MPEEKELTPEQIEANRKKSEGVKSRWTRQKTEQLAMTNEERNAKKFDFDCFKGIRMSPKQKELVVTFMDPPYFGRQEFKQTVYKKVYNPSTENSLKANSHATFKKPNIQEAIRAYQVYALKNHKLEVTTESIETLRRRANYSVSTFYNDDGTCKELNEIPKEWLVCIDNIKIDKKSNAGKGVIETKEYKLCDRDKARQDLVKMLGVYQEMESLKVSVPVNDEKTAIDTAQGQSNAGPRVMFNMTVGNPNAKD